VLSVGLPPARRRVARHYGQA